jgi:hypothetical protein
VTGFVPEIDHSQSCHRAGAASKYQTGEREAVSDQKKFLATAVVTTRNQRAKETESR